MEKNSTSSATISNLICLEDATDFEAETEPDDQYEIFLLLKDTVFLDSDELDEHYVETLISRETTTTSSSNNASFTSCTCHSTTTDSWFQNARRDAIRWFLRMRVRFRFSFETPYLALIYFDSFFSQRTTTDSDKPWPVRLASVACLSLAAKMEECRVPALQELEVDEYAFDNETIRRMELLVLDTMGWQMRLVTPFQYIRYFISKFECDFQPKYLVHRAIRYIFASVDVIGSIEFRPSVTATAAILAASCETLDKDSVTVKLSSISFFGEIDKEQVFYCYRVMTGNSQKRVRSPKRPVSSTSLSASFPSTDDAIESTYSTLSRDKRRRLHLSDST